MDIDMGDGEGNTLKERKMKRFEEIKRKKIEEQERRKRDHTPTQNKGDKSPNQVKDMSKSPIRGGAGGPSSKSPLRREWKT